MKQAKKLLKIWLSLSAIFIILFFMWISIHELSHASVCKSLGKTPVIQTILPSTTINCVGVVENNKLMINNLQYLFLSMSPYIVMLIILISLFFTKRYLVGQYFLTIIFLMDILFNYIFSLFKTTDFRNLAIVNMGLFYISVFITLIVVIIGFYKLKKDFNEVLTKIKGVVI